MQLLLGSRCFPSPLPPFAACLPHAPCRPTLAGPLAGLLPPKARLFEEELQAQLLPFCLPKSSPFWSHEEVGGQSAPAL